MRVKEARISLLKRLEQKKTAVLDRWTGLVFGTYPPDTAMVLKARGDRFGNPVGYCVEYNLGSILDGLLSGDEPETLFSNLEEIIKVRAVQDFTPAGAVSFMALLKDAVSPEIHDGDKSDRALKELEEKIDRLSGVSTTIYNECKQKIGRIRLNEQRKTAVNMSRMMGTAESGK